MTEDSKAYWAWLQLSIILRCRTNPMAFDGIIYPKRTQTIVAKYIGRW